MLPVQADSTAVAAIRASSVLAFIAQFDTNPFAISRVLRQIRDEDPGWFHECALRAMAELPESTGIRFIATLVPLSEPVLELIANPKAFEYAGSKRIVEVMRRIDTQTEAKLVRLISQNPARPLPPQSTDRILDVVDEITDSPRLVPVLMQIFRSASPYLRARLSLSIGRLHRNKEWIEERMRDPDSRVRANAVEANWGQKDEPALSLFAAALRDVHHRVIANGAVGLYYAGDLRSLRMFGELLESPVAATRSAGLWAIGHVQDTRFQGRIAGVNEERDVMVRRSLVVAQARLKRAVELRTEQPKLQLRLIKSTRQMLPACPEEALPRFHNHVFLEVKQPEGSAPFQAVKPIQFQIYENDEAILDYSIQVRTSYFKPHCYDIYFDAATRPTDANGAPTPVRHLKIAVLVEGASGEHESYDFGETPEPKPVVEKPAAEPVHTWNAFR